MRCYGFIQHFQRRLSVKTQLRRLLTKSQTNEFDKNIHFQQRNWLRTFRSTNGIEILEDRQTQLCQPNNLLEKTE